MIDVDVELLGAKALQDGGRPFLRFNSGNDLEKAAAILSAKAIQRAPDPEPAPSMPEHMLPIRVSSARAVSLGYRPYAAIASVFITNVRVDEKTSMLIEDEAGPVIAVAAEHARILTSLSPPTISNIDLEGARRGMPALRLPRLGLWKRGLRLSSCPSHALPLSGAAQGRASAERWLAELDKAWSGRVRSVVLVGWPVYPSRDEHASALDAAEGNLLPPPSPNIFTKEAKERTR